MSFLLLLGVRMSNLLHENLCKNKRQNTITGLLKKMSEKVVQSTSPQKKVVQSTSPQKKVVQSTSPQKKVVQSTSPQKKVVQSTSPQKNNGPQCEKGEEVWFCFYVIISLHTEKQP